MIENTVTLPSFVLAVEQRALIVTLATSYFGIMHSATSSVLVKQSHACMPVLLGTRNPVSKTTAHVLVIFLFIVTGKQQHNRHRIL